MSGEPFFQLCEGSKWGPSGHVVGTTAVSDLCECFA